MPRGKTGKTVIASNIGKARKDTETTSIDKSKNLDPNLTTATKLRRSPRRHVSSEIAARTIGNYITTKNDANVRSTTTLRLPTESTVTSKAAGKSSPKSKDKAKAVVQPNRRTSGGPKSADPVPPPSSTRHLRPGREPKVSAKTERRAGRDPERSASRHRTKRQKGKADNPWKISAIGRDTHNKVTSKSITELIPAPVDSAETLRAEEPQVGPIQEDTWASGSHQLLTEETLEELARRLESDPTNRNRSAKEIARGNSGEESEDGSSQGNSIDSQERFNRKWGYVPPLNEETTRIIEAIIKNPARAETMVGIGPEHKEFLTGLLYRNVSPKPSTDLDPRKDEIQSISLEGYLQETREQETSYDELWKSDRAKCTPDSSEALYQRTLMINLIARHCLIYQFDSSKEQIFDFSVEEPWGCPPMPSRLIWERARGQKSDAKFLTQPKPDLAVCFKREAVIADWMWETLPEPTKRLACFEDTSANRSRIFHFLVVEAKKALIDLGTSQALHQCLNNASQALHNMFEFFRDAGPEHEQVFYNKVRFFSVVANGKGILVRIHRAIKKPDNARRTELVMPDQPDYRLKFEFQEFQRIDDADDRRKVLEVIRKILKYATDDLLTMINAAASKLAENLEKDLEMYDARCEADFYSHGQPHPNSFKSSRRTSVVPSTIGDGVQRLFQSANLDHSKASGQTTPKQPHQPAVSSRLATPANKRRVDEIESDELEDMRARDPPARKRRRRSCSNSEMPLPSPAIAGITVGSQ